MAVAYVTFLSPYVASATPNTQGAFISSSYRLSSNISHHHACMNETDKQYVRQTKFNKKRKKLSPRQKGMADRCFHSDQPYRLDTQVGQASSSLPGQRKALKGKKKSCNFHKRARGRNRSRVNVGLCAAFFLLVQSNSMHGRDVEIVASMAVGHRQRSPVSHSNAGLTKKNPASFGQLIGAKIYHPPNSLQSIAAVPQVDEGIFCILRSESFELMLQNHTGTINLLIIY